MRKMFLKQLILLIFCVYFASSSTRIFMRKCGMTGFACRGGKALSLYFECPSKTEHYFISLNEFNAPRKTTQLFIKNCNALTIIPKCTKYAMERKFLKYLEVSNVKILRINATRLYQSQFPTRVVFKNIANILPIPSNSFTQFDRKLNTVGCITPSTDLQSVQFQNVSIDRLEYNAFRMPNQFGNVSFVDVRIKNMQTHSILLPNRNGGIFSMENSIVNTLAPSSFKIAGKGAVFHGNKFYNIPPAGIIATVDTFRFSNNLVDILEAHALWVLSENVSIVNNNFELLRREAFHKIGYTSVQPIAVGRKLPILKFTYTFERNSIGLMENGSLEPDFEEYKKNAGNISFSGNSILCSCDNIGWLLQKIGGRSGKTGSLDSFYGMILHEDNANICSNCSLNIAAAVGMIQNGACIRTNVKDICKVKDTLTTNYLNNPTKIHQTTTGLKFSPQPPFTMKLPTAVTVTDFDITPPDSFKTSHIPKISTIFSIKQRTNMSTIIPIRTNSTKTHKTTTGLKFSPQPPVTTKLPTAVTRYFRITPQDRFKTSHILKIAAISSIKPHTNMSTLIPSTNSTTPQTTKLTTIATTIQIKAKTLFGNSTTTTKPRLSSNSSRGVSMADVKTVSTPPNPRILKIHSLNHTTKFHRFIHKSTTKYTALKGFEAKNYVTFPSTHLMNDPQHMNSKNLNSSGFSFSISISLLFFVIVPFVIK